jgi:hypothetical protein
VSLGVAVEHDLIRPFVRGLPLLGVVHRPNHDRRVGIFLDQERDLVGQVVDVEGQEIWAGEVEMVEIRPVALLFGA